MTSVGPIQQIVAVIRQQLAAGGTLAGSPKGKPAKAGGSARGDAMALLHRRVQALDPADPERGRKAFRLFLESVLLAEFGEQLINDPAFYRMVDDIQQRMEADPVLNASISKAISHLLARP